MRRLLPFFLVFLGISAYGQKNNLKGDLEKMELFLQSLDERYVDSVETSTIVEKGIRAMLEELDPHSVYLNPDQYRAASEPLAGKYKGIGIRYHMVDDTLTILEVVADSPAEKAGISTGDQVLAVGKDTLSGKSHRSRDITKMLKDPANQDQPLAIIRAAGIVEEVELERATVYVSSVPTYYVMDNHIGYIKLNRFSSTSIPDFRNALDELNKQNVDGLILDLRGNSGGYLNVAIKILDEFLDDRRLIVYTEGTHQARKETYATSGGRFTKGDLVVLIDENSASASEIVAGAIQDWDRGLIIGRRSYGKGLVQRTVEFEDGSAMRLTISRYYTPTGRSIQKPYNADLVTYKNDIRNRRSTGELFSRDSIKINDTLVYFTPGRRKVYGGGGIVPDVFVPADSSHHEGVRRMAQKRGLVHAYALKYKRNHQSELASNFKNIESYTHSFQWSEEEMQDFALFLKKRGLEFTEEEFKEDEALLNRELKTMLGRFQYGYQAHFYCANSYDAATMKAVEALENNTFKELGLK